MADCEQAPDASSLPPWALWPEADPRCTNDPNSGWRPVQPFESRETGDERFLFDPAAGAWIVSGPATDPGPGTTPVVVVGPIVTVNAELPRDLL